MASDTDNKKNPEEIGNYFAINSGLMLISVLKTLSEDQSLEDKSRASIKQEWTIIEDWLGCHGRELTKLDNDKISKAWKAYVAKGISPSEKLQEHFDYLSKKYKEEGYSSHEEQAPDAVIGVFQRLLATEKEISDRKRNADKPVFVESSNADETLSKKSNVALSDVFLSNNIAAFKLRSSRQRLVLFVSLIWFLLSIPLSMNIYEEYYFRSNDFFGRIFCWAIMASAAWLPLGWKWVYDNQIYSRFFVISVIFIGALIVFIFSQDYEFLRFLAIIWIIVFIVIILLHDGIRIIKSK